MTFREKVDLLLEENPLFVRTNPERAKIADIDFNIVFESENSNNIIEVEKLLRQSKIEQTGIIYIFNALYKQPFENLLISTIFNMEDDEWYPLVLAFAFDEVNETFIPVLIREIEEFKLVIEDLLESNNEYF